MGQNEKDEFVRQILNDPEKKKLLGRSMMDEINRNIWERKHIRFSSPVSQIPEFHCPVCGLIDPDHGAEVGCNDCIVRSVTES